ncbi:hypothetical protein AnigIFM56816_004814 [Aspergillus niger]|uniref:Contig An09c0150, genomic contig n=3 Tax=Aspergillus niger TaxID=5061 RepID=A2QUB6_ASPNC|nr:uncharacterized protein An09g05060 [Aspergillus niger]XP_025448306.1 uncharacterized protein BO96DRAFT_406331 [Aspergillus niger CBS 101883]RDH14233.1 hypothetical protein M747DRAFT_169607 [Aspergillus niger ATCC 13496]KAI2812686.1 transcriptional regulator family: Fungal Specific TF [Aspergillus niger]KAI2836810.1 transcriptional regulator family: Fungal Specific TF [Aspergillus niger]KAI2869326.1 transcriptional regulator family: Fungal Specific TF [Aspergillus niger]PYH50251.1 hypotheti|eukprot:XP_001393818.1 protein RDR1 [Aspergillus niger CBS 513.88]
MSSALDRSSRPPIGSIRRRTKKACETCKLRKRKCDGHEPCSFCLKYEYDCAYEAQPRKKPSRPSIARPSTKPLERASSPALAARADVNQQQMEANSGTAFPHFLGKSLNPQNPPKVHGFSWNLGLRHEPIQQFANISSLVSKDEMSALVGHYLERIHPIYAVLDLDMLEKKVGLRWDNSITFDSYDPVLCGVAALGSLYSGDNGHRNEEALVQCAKEILEATCTMNKPLIHHATGWVLRTLYLRSTGCPHTSWMASCSAMHIIEAAGAHQDPGMISLVYSDTADVGVDEESQRRLFWVATVLNTWISYEYGRSRVILRGISCKPPVPRAGDLTAELVSLFQISQRLDPDQNNRPSDLEDVLYHVQSLTLSHDALVLSQANLALTIYRRLRVAASSISNDVINCVIRMGSDGTAAAVRMSENRSPWWHVANVPFQFLCILLAIDSKESLSHVGHAMRSFKTIGSHFNTPTVHIAIETVDSLIKLLQRKKEREINLLRDSIQDQDSGPFERNLSSTQEYGSPLQGGLFDGNNLEMIDWDWNAFFDAEIPLFDDRGHGGQMRYG